MIRTITCPSCSNHVATLREGGAWEVRHKKRMLLAPVLLEIQCEDCGHIWCPQEPTQEPRMGRVALPTIRRVA